MATSTPAGTRGAEPADTRAVTRPNTLRRRGPTPRPLDGVRAGVASPPSSSLALVLAFGGIGRTAPHWRTLLEPPHTHAQQHLSEGTTGGQWTCGSRGLPLYDFRQRRTHEGGWVAFR